MAIGTESQEVAAIEIPVWAMDSSDAYYLGIWKLRREVCDDRQWDSWEWNREARTITFYF